MANFGEVWKKTKVFEGKYQAMPKDSANYCPAQGKPGSTLIGTNFGISAIGLAQYLGRCPTVVEVKGLQEGLAQKVAKKQYWDQIQGDKIKSQALGHLIFDMTYGGSAGPLQVRKAINNLAGKGTVNEFKSFKLSDNEINWINKLPEKKLFAEIYKQRIDYYKGHTYEKGLTNRLKTLASEYYSDLSTAAVTVKTNWLPIVIGLVGLGVGLYFVLRKKK